MDTVTIGAASATFVDSRIAMPQLLGCGVTLDYLVFDCLAEGVMGLLARSQAAGAPGWVVDFVDGQMAPHLQEIADRGIRVVANAGGLDPLGCAAALRERIASAGLNLRVAAITGDDLRGRVADIVGDTTVDMFDGTPIATRLATADRLLSCSAYVGAFPIAASLGAGADIVVAGRIVDSAATLGPLIHAFGWSAADSDLLAAGTLVGHLLECTTQLTGGTFTDWEDVPGWANIGFPIATCRADGSADLFKPEGTGGLLSTATAAEQLLYEVSDPQRYVVPDVICDFTAVRLSQRKEDRVAVSGARGFGRPSQLKASVSWDEGWRATAMFPVIGHAAAAKAHRTAAATIERVEALLRARQLPPFTQTHVDVVGGNGPGASQAVCRIVVDHTDVAAAQLFAREKSSAMTSMAVGISNPLGTSITPVTRIGSVLIPRETVTLAIDLDGTPVRYAEPSATGQIDAPPPLPPPPTPEDIADGCSAALLRIAWARSGDKGDLFNVGVIARRPEWLPYLYAALTPDAVGRHYGGLLADGRTLGVERFAVPGIHALNLVVAASLHGGMMASPRLDPAAKGMAQLLLDFPVPISRKMHDLLQRSDRQDGQGL